MVDVLKISWQSRCFQTCALAALAKKMMMLLEIQREIQKVKRRARLKSVMHKRVYAYHMHTVHVIYYILLFNNLLYVGTHVHTFTNRLSNNNIITGLVFVDCVH